MKFKPVWTWSAPERKVRLFRIVWERGVVGDGDGYSAMLSFSFVPRLYANVPVLFGFDVTVLGVRMHHKRAYGGRFV